MSPRPGAVRSPPLLRELLRSWAQAEEELDDDGIMMAYCVDVGEAPSRYGLLPEGDGDFVIATLRRLRSLAPLAAWDLERVHKQLHTHGNEVRYRRPAHVPPSRIRQCRNTVDARARLEEVDVLRPKGRRYHHWVLEDGQRRCFEDDAEHCDHIHLHSPYLLAQVPVGLFGLLLLVGDHAGSSREGSSSVRYKIWEKSIIWEKKSKAFFWIIFNRKLINKFLSSVGIMSG